jgi:hypothetical protein
MQNPGSGDKRRWNDAGFHSTFKDDAKIATCLGLYPALLLPMRGEYDPATYQHEGRYSLRMVFLQCRGLQDALADAVTITLVRIGS